MKIVTFLKCQHGPERFLTIEFIMFILNNPKNNFSRNSEMLKYDA